MPRYSQQSLRGQSFSVGARLVGDWNKLLLLTEEQQTQGKKTAEIGMNKSAEIYLAQLKKNLKGGGGKFGYDALSHEYQEKKSKAGLSVKMFELTGTLISSVSIYRTTRGNIAVGIGDKKAQRPKVDGFGEPGKITVGQYARILEKGRGASGKGGPQPARPIFKDTWIEIGGKKMVSRHVVKELKKFYRKYGIDA